MDLEETLVCTQPLFDYVSDTSTTGERIEVGRLVVKGTIYSVYTGENRVGRNPRTCSIILDGNALSKEHAVIEVHDFDNHLIYDLGSMNGTRLDKKMLKTSVRYQLRNKSEILFADVNTTYHILPKEEVVTSNKEFNDINEESKQYFDMELPTDESIIQSSQPIYDNVISTNVFRNSNSEVKGEMCDEDIIDLPTHESIIQSSQSICDHVVSTNIFKNTISEVEGEICDKDIIEVPTDELIIQSSQPIHHRVISTSMFKNSNNEVRDNTYDEDVIELPANEPINKNSQFIGDHIMSTDVIQNVNSEVKDKIHGKDIIELPIDETILQSSQPIYDNTISTNIFKNANNDVKDKICVGDSFIKHNIDHESVSYGTESNSAIHIDSYNNFSMNARQVNMAKLKENFETSIFSSICKNICMPIIPSSDEESSNVLNVTTKRELHNNVRHMLNNEEDATYFNCYGEGTTVTSAKTNSCRLFSTETTMNLTQIKNNQKETMECTDMTNFNQVHLSETNNPRTGNTICLGNDLNNSKYHNDIQSQSAIDIFDVSSEVNEIKSSDSIAILKNEDSQSSIYEGSKLLTAHNLEDSKPRISGEQYIKEATGSYVNEGIRSSVPDNNESTRNSLNSDSESKTSIHNGENVSNLNSDNMVFNIPIQIRCLEISKLVDNIRETSLEEYNNCGKKYESKYSSDYYNATTQVVIRDNNDVVPKFSKYESFLRFQNDTECNSDLNTNIFDAPTQLINGDEDCQIIPIFETKSSDRSNSCDPAIDKKCHGEKSVVDLEKIPSLSTMHIETSNDGNNTDMECDNEDQQQAIIACVNETTQLLEVPNNENIQRGEENIYTDTNEDECDTDMLKSDSNTVTNLQNNTTAFPVDCEKSSSVEVNDSNNDDENQQQNIICNETGQVLEESIHESVQGGNDSVELLQVNNIHTPRIVVLKKDNKTIHLIEKEESKISTRKLNHTSEKHPLPPAFNLRGQKRTLQNCNLFTQQKEPSPATKSRRINEKGQNIHRNDTYEAPFPIPSLIPRVMCRQKEMKESNSLTINKVLFTGLECSPGDKIKIESLGGSVVLSPNDCAVLVTDKVRRTYKLLSTLVLGKPIVSYDWLLKSKNSEVFLDPWKFIVEDKEAEFKFKFSLRKSLKLASQRQLLEGYSTVFTPNIKPPPSEMKNIIENSGGRVLCMNSRSKWPDKCFVISCTADKALWSKFKSKQRQIVSTEAILLGVLQQKLDLKTHALH